MNGTDPPVFDLFQGKNQALVSELLFCRYRFKLDVIRMLLLYLFCLCIGCIWLAVF